MLYDVQVHFLRIDTLGWFLKLAHVDFILMLEEGSSSSTFHLSLIYAIINAYNDLDHVSQLIRFITPSDLVLHMILKTSVEGVH
jgi:hypothetical protein